ncbi:DUF4287 domain-containing protein, partial [Pseudonocardia oceani]|uniref:DUF4287 domain-containing protein n=1 Tax=Pseudonocardia oceani TaxID=2792013 RepID=UPI0027E27BD5
MSPVIGRRLPDDSTARRTENAMSFQAYLDAIEKKTGRIPADLVALAHERGYGPDTKAGVMVEWLKTDFDLGRG